MTELSRRWILCTLLFTFLFLIFFPRKLFLPKAVSRTSEIPVNWGEIWQHKATPEREPSSIEDLIIVDGFDHAQKFRHVLNDYASLVKLKADDVLCDIGAGSGAFLHVLPPVELALCVDLSLNMLKVSHRFVDKHRPDTRAIYIQSSITDLWQVPAAFCDVTVVQSVLHYLPDLEAVRQAVSELERISKPGGTAYVFDLRDGNLGEYLSLRGKAGITHTDRHLFVPRSFWGGAWMVHEPSATAKKNYYNAPFSYHVSRGY